MINFKDVVMDKARPEFTDEEINSIAEWLTELNLTQLMFLKESYEAFLQMHAIEMGSPHVH